MSSSSMIARHSSRFARALQLAYELHADQSRKKDGPPTIGHLLSAAGIVIEYGGTEDEAIAALLHDAIEDAGGTRTGDRIREEFGPSIADIVEGCSDTDQSPKPPWDQRKREYLEHLPTASSSVRFVSCADKLANVRSLIADYRAKGETLWERFNAPKEKQLWVNQAYADEFLRDPSPPMAAELGRQVRVLRELVG